MTPHGDDAWRNRRPLLRVTTGTLFLLLITNCLSYNATLHRPLTDHRNNSKISSTIEPTTTFYNVVVTETPQQNLHRKTKITDYMTPQTVVRKNSVPPSSSSLRYAAFGTSDTWGTGIEGDRSTLTYPTLLSPFQLQHPTTLSPSLHQNNNFAIRASGPNFPGACTHSLMGENVFDVIVLEFHQGLSDGLELLARRIRERFPGVIIIMLREWWPLQIKNREGINVRKWALRQGFDGAYFGANDPIIHRAFMATAEEEQWRFDLGYREDLVGIQDFVAEKYGAYLLPMERPREAKDWVKYQHLISKDWRHKSNAGHEEVARRVSSFVEKLLDDNIVPPASPTVKKWSNVDHCVMWFLSGDTSGIELQRRVKVSNFSHRNAGAKYALELEDGKGVITVANPSLQHWTKLYLTYMITDPPPSKYPVTKVTLKNDYNVSTELLEQKPAANWGGSWVHVHEMKMVGLVPPQKTTELIFEEMERDKEWPFRLVAVVLTEENLVDSHKDFSRHWGFS